MLCHKAMEQDPPVRDRYREEEQEEVGRGAAEKVVRLLGRAGNAFALNAGQKLLINAELPAFNRSVHNAEHQ